MLNLSYLVPQKHRNTKRSYIIICTCGVTIPGPIKTPFNVNKVQHPPREPSTKPRIHKYVLKPAQAAVLRTENFATLKSYYRQWYKNSMLSTTLVYLRRRFFFFFFYLIHRHHHHRAIVIIIITLHRHLRLCSSLCYLRYNKGATRTSAGNYNFLLPPRKGRSRLSRE